MKIKIESKAAHSAVGRDLGDYTCDTGIADMGVILIESSRSGICNLDKVARLMRLSSWWQVPLPFSRQLGLKALHFMRERQQLHLFLSRLCDATR